MVVIYGRSFVKVLESYASEIAIKPTEFLLLGDCVGARVTNIWPFTSPQVFVNLRFRAFSKTFSGRGRAFRKAAGSKSSAQNNEFMGLWRPVKATVCRCCRYCFELLIIIANRLSKQFCYWSELRINYQTNYYINYCWLIILMILGW